MQLLLATVAVCSVSVCTPLAFILKGNRRETIIAVLSGTLVAYLVIHELLLT